MNDILLIDNQEVFEKYDIITISTQCDISDIPDRSCILFFGSHERGCDHIYNDLVTTLGYLSMKQPNKYILLVGKTDDTIPSTIDSHIPSNVIRIYANNIDYVHPLIRFFPMGRDFRSKEIFSSMSSNVGLDGYNDNDRPVLCYCNYSVNTHPCRKKIYERICEKEFMKFEHMGNFLDYRVSRTDFFKNLATSKFIICPRGNAIDTFRFYDAVYYGCIPIVVKTDFHRQFEHLPILFLESEDEYAELSEEFLRKEYERLHHKHRVYYEELDMEWWLNNAYIDLLANVS